MPRGYLPVLLLGIVAITATCLALRWRALSTETTLPGPFLAEASAESAPGPEAPAASASLLLPAAHDGPAPSAPAETSVTPSENSAKEPRPAQAPAGPLDINAATAAQFDELPGIGPVLAQRIVDYRKAHGAFKTVSQLQDVEGIGPKKFADLKAKVYVKSGH